MTTPTPPSPRPARLAYPTRTKVVVVAVLAVAGAAFVLGYLTTADRGGPAAELSGVGAGTGERVAGGVEALLPRDGAEILGQELIGIDLAPGWTGELLLLPGNGQATTLPEDELVRDELNRITYQPRPGRAIERLSGDYCIAATIWDRVEGRESTQRTVNWCFSAT
jgi:hypothetical protein